MKNKAYVYLIFFEAVISLLFSYFIVNLFLKTTLLPELSIREAISSPLFYPLLIFFFAVSQFLTISMWKERQKVHKVKTKKILQGIDTPDVAGQGQYGTARFMTEEEIEEHLPFYSLPTSSFRKIRASIQEFDRQAEEEAKYVQEDISSLVRNFSAKDWTDFSRRKQHESNLIAYQDKYNWEVLLTSKKQKISDRTLEAVFSNLPQDVLFREYKMSKEFIDRVSENINEKGWNSIAAYYTLKEDFIIRHMNQLDLGLISRHQQFSDAFYRSFADRVDWSTVDGSKKTLKFILDHRQRLNWTSITKNYHFENNVEILGIFFDYLDYRVLPENKKLVRLIDRAAEQLKAKEEEAER